jgi:endogenous inhibitor of DNA gyrase (YacG/DUF329 family)
MVFIVQCPACRKHMFMEDSVRGARVPCVLCQKPMQVSSSGSGERSRPPPQPQRAGKEQTPTARGQRIVNRPKCSAPLRLAPEQQDTAVCCPRCQQVFVGKAS